MFGSPHSSWFNHCQHFWSSSLHTVLHSADTLSLPGPNTVLRTQFLNTISLCPGPAQSLFLTFHYLMKHADQIKNSKLHLCPSFWDFRVLLVLAAPNIKHSTPFLSFLYKFVPTDVFSFFFDSPFSVFYLYEFWPSMSMCPYNSNILFSTICTIQY
jgi:hypothetical protein